MSKRNLLIEPDPILRKKSETIGKIDNDLRKLLDDMLETMYSAPGIGLAAVQVGILKRLVVIDISKEDEKKSPLFLSLFYKKDNCSPFDLFNGCAFHSSGSHLVISGFKALRS